MPKNNIWIYIFLLLIMSSCGRKDVHRNGDIKLRGEKSISLRGKKSGEYLQKGLASWYGKKYHGRKTSNGETYNMYAMTAAHKSLPFNTLVRVKNLDNGKETIVRINDRGPFIKGRIIDLSKSAAKDIGLDLSGIAKVKLYLSDESEKRSTIHTSIQPTEVDQKTGTWTIQVGSFSEFLRARNLVDRFKDSEYKVRIEKFSKMYRVRIGSFREKQQAVIAMQSLDLNGLDSWVLEVLEK